MCRMGDERMARLGPGVECGERWQQVVSHARALSLGAGCSVPVTGGGPMRLTAATEAGVEVIAQRIAEEAKPKDGDRDCDAGEDRHPGRAHRLPLCLQE